MAKKKATVNNLDISNVPHQLKSSLREIFIDIDEVELSADFEESIKAITAAFRTKILEEWNELKRVYPHESVSIASKTIYFGGLDFPFYISRLETDAEVITRIKAANLKRAKQIAEAKKLSTELGFTLPENLM